MPIRPANLVAAHSPLAFIAVLAACGGPAGSGADLAVEPPDMTVPPPPTPCGRLELPARPWNEGPYGTRRDEVAGDFTVVDQDGAWSFKDRRSGCESYVFIPDNITVSSANADSIWTSDLDLLLARSPANVHYFFVSKKTDPKPRLDLISAQIDGALAQFPDGDAPGQKDWWRAHLHLVQTSVAMQEGWIGDALRLAASASTTGQSLAIDRFQRIRGIGSLADVARVNNGLPWPFENNMAYAANPPIYFNYEAAREDALAAEQSATVVTVYQHEILSGVVEKDVALPDAATMKKFDRLEVDLDMACPRKDKFEEWQISDDLTNNDNYNCGPWDYIVQIDVRDDDGKTWRELARFISTYHRAGRYLVDASQLIPLLSPGGTRHIRYTISPAWNLQKYDTTMRWRFSDSGGGMRPTHSTFLYAGGAFDQNYNASHMTPVTVPIPAGAKKVELRAIITGHGGVAPDNCAEFCNHQHEFTVGGKVLLKQFDDTIGDDEGCMKQIWRGVVPNQSGTWWLGRGGWCPGAQVDPWIVDVTAQATPGQDLVVSYRGLFNGTPVTRARGDIAMSSWIVVWE